MKGLIRHILKEEINNKKLKMIKKYVELYVGKIKIFNEYVCEVLVQDDRGLIVVDVFIDDAQYKLLDFEYNLYYLQTNIRVNIMNVFGIKNDYEIAVYLGKCSDQRITYD